MKNRTGPDGTGRNLIESEEEKVRPAGLEETVNRLIKLKGAHKQRFTFTTTFVETLSQSLCVAYGETKK